MKNLILKSAVLIALFYAVGAAAASTSASTATNTGLSAGSAAAVGGAMDNPNLNNGTSNNSNYGTSGASVPGASSHSSGMPTVTTSPNSYFGSAGYGTGMGSEGMSGPGGAVSAAGTANTGVSSGTTMSAPGSQPYNAGDAGNYVNQSATAPVYQQPLYGAPAYNPNNVNTSVTSPPSGTSSNLGY